MCGGPDQSNTTSNSKQSPVESNSTNNMKEANQRAIDTSLLELAANNDLEGFTSALDMDDSAVFEAGLWYGRQKGSRQMVFEQRTPLMIAATYGSLDVLKLILAHPGLDVNFSGVPDKSTALHCAASGGSVDADEAVKLLLEAGADPNAVDVNGLRPFDVIVAPPKLPSKRALLEFLLANSSSSSSESSRFGPKLSVSVTSSGSSSPPLSSSPDNGSPSSPSDSGSSPKTASSNGLSANQQLPEKKEYPIDPSLPDINNSMYSTDEFRMFSFKIRPCSRAYSHDWTECPFVHPGENARRRDPRKYHYSCVPCPDFRKGACRRGDMCEYAHGVFECWLHPAQYRTRLCKDGVGCNRRVCFFAHTPEELRPLYMSTGLGAMPSPRAAVMDMAAAMNLYPGSPSAISAMSPSPFSPQSPTGSWSQQNVPALHLPPGSNLQSSRLRSSLSARDIPPENLNMLSDFEAQQQLLDDLASFSQPRSNPAASLLRSSRSRTLAPSNLEDLFCSEIASSPRYSDQAGAIFSPTHRSALMNQFQQQQSLLSPINTSNPLLQASMGVSSPRSGEPISPMSARLSALALREKQQLQMRSLSSRSLGAKLASPMMGSPVNSWTNWGSPDANADWSVNGGDELGRGRLRSPSPFEFANNGEEGPDLSWVQSLVKESPPEMVKEKHPGGVPVYSGNEGLATKASMDSVDHSVISAWLEQMQLDQPLPQ